MIACAYTHFSVYMDVTKGLLPLFRHNAPCCHQALLAIWYFSTPAEQSSVPIFAGSQRINIAPSRWLVLTKWEKLGWVQTSNNRLQVKSICGEPKLQVIRSVFHLGDLLTSNVSIIGLYHEKKTKVFIFSLIIQLLRWEKVGWWDVDVIWHGFIPDHKFHNALAQHEASYIL